MRLATKGDVAMPILAPLGELIYELVGAAAEVGGTTKHSLARVVVPPGKRSPRHYHTVSEETYFVLAGAARLVIDGRTVTLAPGEACLIMPGETHQVCNDRADDLEFLVVCAPPWTADDFFEV